MEKTNRKKKIWVFIGNMGSGKSEISINFTYQRQKSNPDEKIKLIDMDIVKPYIRIRDKEEEISKLGVDLLLPDKAVRDMDMPIVPSHINDHIRNDSFNLVMDVGGEEAGSTTIAQFNSMLNNAELEVFLVINTKRPFSNTPELIVKTLKSLEHYSRLKVTGLISNTHLRFDTSQEEILEGLEKLEVASKIVNIPIKIVAVWHKMLTKELEERIKYPIIPLRLFLTFPWEESKPEGI
ncbi:MAG: hypothetical protein KAH01_03855 [Caldisericia bacterium]|nr:hypothetical protein [Caldisericia bacterium]